MRAIWPVTVRGFVESDGSGAMQGWVSRYGSSASDVYGQGGLELQRRAVA
jgi:hypothetical protein